MAQRPLAALSSDPPCRPFPPSHLHLQLLDNPVAERRLAACHLVLGNILAGMLPPDWPPGRSVQCQAALASLCLFVGWLLPTYAVLQWHRHEHGAAAAPTPAAEAAAAAAGASDEAAGDPGGGGRGGAGAPLRAPPARQPWSLWFGTNVFMLGNPPEIRCAAWAVLTVACWLAGTVWAHGWRPAPGAPQQ